MRPPLASATVEFESPGGGIVRSVCPFAAMGIASVLLLRAENQAIAYLPPQCCPRHAKDDFNQASLVVIGRVTAVERYRVAPSTDSPPKGATEFFYLATITVGRTLKGKAKPGDDVLFYTGTYSQRREDDTAPTWLRVANSHPAWTLEYDHVYLLALDPLARTNEGKAEVRRDGKWFPVPMEKREIWEPRSCHCSVHEITVRNRTEPNDKGPDGMENLRLIPETYVTLYFDRWRESPKGGLFLLDEFIAAQKKGEFPEKELGNNGSPPGSQKAEAVKEKQ